MLNLHRLFLLHELRRLETMTAVAGAHSMSPSAVSQQLSHLERETKVTLFQQVGRRVVLTDAGVQLARRAEEGEPMPTFVVDELRDYLKCGVLAHGAVRFACAHCGTDRLVGISCKGTGVLPALPG